MREVLVVDDSLTQREIICDVLEKGGLKAAVASDGIEALERLGKYQPDLVILDIVMPRMNGFEVCRRLKSNSVTQDIPVILCSSKREEFDRYWGLRQGADAYVVKPFQPTELLSTIKQLLIERRY